MSGIGAAAVIAGGAVAIPGVANAAPTRAAAAPTASQAYSKANQALNWTNKLNTDIYAKPGTSGFPNGGASYRASTALSTANKAESDAKAASGLQGLQADEPYGQDNDPNSSITQSDGSVAPKTTQVVWAACPSGKAAVSGGYRTGDNADGTESDSSSGDGPGTLQVLASEGSYESGGKLDLSAAKQVTSYGSYQPNAWAVTVYNSGSTAQNARAQVICANLGSLLPGRVTTKDPPSSRRRVLLPV